MLFPIVMVSDGWCKLFKSHKNNTSVGSEQKMYLLKNAQNPFEIHDFCTFFQNQTVLLAFARLHYSNLITFFTKFNHFPQITHKVNMKM